MLMVALATLRMSLGSELPLFADDESGALNLLQRKAGAEELAQVELAINMSQSGLAFTEGGEGRFRCGVIYCADAAGNKCCRATGSSICCGPGARCGNSGGLSLCL